MSLSCEICFEVYSTESSGRDVTPRTLRECGHTYCTSCCAQLLSDDKIICPSCREITVCKNGINDLPKAFALINLLNDIKLAPAASSVPPPSSIPSSSSSSHEKSSSDEKAFSDPLDKVDATDTHAGLSITARRSSPSSSSSSSPSPSSDQSDSIDVLLSVRPLLSGSRGRTPIDVCCVVDVSGSMGSEAQIKNDQGQNVSHGLSLLDIVKHAVKTIIRGLGPQDRLSIVSYSSTATTVLGLTAMTETGAKQAETALSALDADGGTNLFDGLKQGLDVLDAAPKSSETSYRTQALLLLSDGLPNISPPQKEMKALRNYFDSHQTLAASCSVHCFGFGYDVDSVLMNNIALEGGGMFVFIPDSSFVGTAFVSTLANLLVTTAGDIRLDIEAINGAEIIKTSKGGSAVLGSHQITSTSWGATVNMGPLQYDQPKDLIAQIRLPSSWSEGTPFIRATLRYHDIILNADESVTVACAKLIDSSSPSSVDVERHLFRSRFIDLIKSIFISESVPHMVEKSSLLQSLINEFKASPFIKDAPFDGLLQDLEGQVFQAFSRSDWMQRWGRHYIPSLVRAHQLQQSNNFKDPGVQFYGGELFKKLRDEADAIFLKIPPPTPSLPQFISSSYSASSGGSSGGGAGIKKKGAPRSAINMSAYHNRNNACFAPWSLISLSNGTLRPVSELKKGDRVKVYYGPSFDQVKESAVRCIVRSRCADHREFFVRLTETMAITSYHPVYDQQSKSFAFPRDLMPIEELECDSVYSILLTEGEESGLIELGGSIKAVTLGHQLRGSSVIQHPFFGSRSVIEAVRNRKGFEEGRVELSESSCIRHPITGLVNGFRE